MDSGKLTHFSKVLVRAGQFRLSGRIWPNETDTQTLFVLYE